VLRPEIEDRDEVEVVIGRSIKTPSILNDIERANLNWNKIRSWDIGDFCKKKNRNSSIFIFLCSRKCTIIPNFFQMYRYVGMSSDTLFKRPLRKEYIALLFPVC
jgi:hypothetical protein